MEPSAVSGVHGRLLFITTALQPNESRRVDTARGLDCCLNVRCRWRGVRAESGCLPSMENKRTGWGFLLFFTAVVMCLSPRHRCFWWCIYTAKRGSAGRACVSTTRASPPASEGDSAFILMTVLHSLGAYALREGWPPRSCLILMVTPEGNAYKSFFRGQETVRD